MSFKGKLMAANAKVDAKVQRSLANQKANAESFRDDLKYESENKIPSIHRKLRFSRDGMIRFEGQTMPVLGAVAAIETSGSTNRTGGMFVNRRHDDRRIWLVIESPTGIFQVGVSGAKETRVRKIVAYITMANRSAQSR